MKLRSAGFFSAAAEAVRFVSDSTVWKCS